MAKEIERKFLVRNSDWRAMADAGVAISQFYLMSGDARSARVRVKGGKAAALTLKFGGAQRVRDEFEYAIPLADAEAMKALALGAVIAKTRHRVTHEGLVWEVDRFHGALDGLVIAEIETPDERDVADLPAWIGTEVTGDSAYYNASLAMNGLPERR